MFSLISLQLMKIIKKILHTKDALFPIKEEGADCAIVADDVADVAVEGAVDIDSIDIGKIKISKEYQRDDDSPSDSDSYYSFSSDDDEQLYISARDFTYYKDLLNINSFYEDKII
jgi:hypothetical protein